MMEQYFVQASPIKYLATLVTLGEVLFFVEADFRTRPIS